MTTTSVPVTTRFSTILIATDFSDASDNALGYAAALARTFRSELLLVHVTDPVSHIAVPEAAWVGDDSARIRGELETTEAAGAALRAEGLKARELCAFGEVAREIAYTAEQQHVDLIVTGTNSRKGLDRLLFGSESESILKSSRVPVLIVGPKAVNAPIGSFVFRFIACAVKLDEWGADVAAFARHFAEEQRAKVQIMAFPFHESGTKTDGCWAFKNRLQSLVAEDVAKQMVPATLSEPLSESLIELAIARDADLIVFDQRSTFLSPHLSASPLSDVLATAPCPVLAIPHAK